MAVIGLYLCYLHNLLKGLNEQQRVIRLKEEQEKIANIVKGLDDLFRDEIVTAVKNNRDIYSMIKLDILTQIIKHSERVDDIVYEEKYILQGVLNEIRIMQNSGLVSN